MRRRGTAGTSKPRKGQAKSHAGRALLRRKYGNTGAPIDPLGPRRPEQLRRAQERAAGQAGEGEVPVLASVLEVSGLDDFIAAAEMSERRFDAFKERDLRIVDAGFEAAHRPPPDFRFESLQVPRRPAWHTGMSKAALDKAEREAFLQWRRGIATLEDAGGAGERRVTPFEKNLEVWRQLWRVLERSHVLVQIVDGRNPLFYSSDDLRDYCGELEPPRECVMVVNKSDYLAPAQRRTWHAYFTRRGLRCLFFSATREQEIIDAAVKEQRAAAEAKLQEETQGDDLIAEDPNTSDSEADEGATPSEIDVDEGHRHGDGGTGVEEDDQSQAHGPGSDATLGLSGDDASRSAIGADARDARDGGKAEEPAEAESDPSVRILTRAELLETLGSAARRHQEQYGAEIDGEGDARPATVGMVGFPNVGKSSVINVLVGASKHAHGGVRVAVGATPGKTKHFQTLLLSAADGERLQLCDCPGLVFPSFVSSTAEMICAGVLQVNTLRDPIPPLDLVCRRIPRDVLEATFSIRIGAEPAPAPLGTDTGNAAALATDEERRDVDGPPAPRELLDAFCTARGYLTAGAGVADINRGAREMLLAYVSGKLLYCHPPPPEDISEREKQVFEALTVLRSKQNVKVAARLAARERSEEAAATAAREADAVEGGGMPEMGVMDDDDLDMFFELVGEDEDFDADLAAEISGAAARNDRDASAGSYGANTGARGGKKGKRKLKGKKGRGPTLLT